MEIAFVSGPTDLTMYEFQCEYEKKLCEAIANKHKFIMGSAPGADRMAMEFLRAIGQPSQITMYLFEKNPEWRNDAIAICKANNVEMKTGFSSYNDRDKQMTEDSTYDIAWYRSIDACKLRYGENYKPRISGTQRNIERRLARRI